MSEKRYRRQRPSRAAKWRVYERDGYRCVQCGDDREHMLTVDHIVPVAKGGTRAMRNLQTLCYSCNQAKGDTLED